MKWTSYIPFAILLGVAALMTAYIFFQPSIKNMMPERDYPVPRFMVASADSKAEVLSSDDLTREVVMVHFMASWCGVCRYESPLIAELSRKIDIPIYGMAMRDTPQAMRKWLDEHENPYDFVGLDASGEIGMAFGIMGIPHTFLVDARGHVRYSHIGPLSPEEIEHRLLPLIKKLKDAPV